MFVFQRGLVGSEFGALLDMLTDRCGTAMLLVILAILYPAFSTLFMALMFLDCFSHWAQMSRFASVRSISHLSSPLRLL